MFDLKKFISLIGTDEVLMELFFLNADEVGLEPHFDIYHVLDGTEKPTDAEIEVMKNMYSKFIVGTDFEKQYNTADVDFPERLAFKIKRRSGIS